MNTFLRSTFFTGFKLKYTVLAFLLVGVVSVGWGQVTLYSENFGTTTALPTGWTSTNITNGWAGSTASASTTYTGASGGTNVLFNGTGTNGVTHTLTYSNNLSTVGYNNITVLWGGRGTTAFNGTITFEYNSGSGWNTVTYTYTPNANAWALVNGGVRIVLPTAAENVSNLQFRWSAASTNSGNYRIDDFSVQGTLCPAPTITTQPSNPSAVCNSYTGNIGLTASGTITGYQWQYSANGTTGWANVVNNTPAGATYSNQTTNTLTVSSLTSTGYYRCIVANGACTVISNTVTVTVNTSPVITTQPSNAIVTSPGTATFTVVASGTIAGYQWQVNDGSGWVNASSAPYSGGTTATLTVNPSTTSLDGYAFQCLIFATAPCTPNVTSNSAILTVLDGPCVSDASGYAGWTLSGATSSPNQACTGNGILFTASGQFAVTPSVTNPLFLNFNKQRSSNSTAWSMDVQISTSPTGPWTTVSTITSITATCSPNTSIDLSAYTGLRYIRFLDTRASGNNERGIDDITITCGTSCTPVHTVTSFTPSSGPAGTIVTITGTGFTAASTVRFGSAAASVTYVDANTLRAVVPSNATTNRLTITESGCEVVTTSNFTFLSQNANCGTGAFGTNGLIISEVFDSQVGTLSYIELFNPTNAAISLSTYSLRITTDGPTNTDYALGSASIPSGGVYVISLGDDTFSGSSVCGVTVNLAFPAGSGFNGNDRVILRRSGVDHDVVNNPNFGSSNSNSFKGFSQLRNQGVLNPTTSYNSSEWSNSSTESCSNLGIAPSSLSSSNVTITTQPSNVNCAAVTFSVTATATPGTINYVWYYQSPGSASWLLVSSLNGTNGLTVAGSGTASITITGNTSILRDYQFYCEIGSGGSPQCIRYTNAVQYTYDSRPYYRTIASGQWTNPAIWQMSDTETGTYVAACQYPVAANSDKVNILNTHTVTLDVIDVTIDWVDINSGGALTIGSSSMLTFNNGNSGGADFEVNGTLTDGGSNANGIDFNTGATWQLGTNATVIRNNTSQAGVYRDNYHTGMVNIPATANWIIRGSNTVNVLFTTVNTFYPNLTFESTSGLWDPSAATTSSRFTGTTGGFATVKGNLDIGGTGAGTVTVYNENTNATALQVLGNLTVRSGSTLTNNGNASGTGFEVRGNVSVAGTLTVNGTAGNAGTLIMSGTTPQSISGAGTYNLYNFTVNNSGAIGAGSGVTLNRALSMDGLLNLINGLVHTTSTNLLSLTATATTPAGGGGDSAAFVNGPMRKTGTAAFEFPVGRLVGSEGYYGMIGINAVASTTTFEALFYRANAALLGPVQFPLMRVSFCEYWDLNRISGTEDVLVTLSWTPRSRCAVSYISNINAVVVANLNSSSTWINRFGANRTGDGNAGTVQATAIPLAYPRFALGTTDISQAPLPVLLNTFTATPKHTAVTLDWAVGNNHQQQQYVLERSSDGRNFETITTVNAKQGLTLADYSFDDAKPLSGWNYYRLRARDLENKTNTSTIIKVWWGRAAAVNILPNPASEKIVINLSAPSSIKEIQIVNAMGQVVRTITTVQFFNEVNISSLQAGMYYIRFLGESGLTTKSFVKQ